VNATEDAKATLKIDNAVAQIHFFANFDICCHRIVETEANRHGRK
jgi:hypothetical protein